MAGVIGSSSVEIVPDARDFGEKLRRDLLPQLNRVGEEAGRILSDRIQAAMSGVRVRFDTAGATGQVDDLSRRISSLGRGQAARIQVDTTEFDAKIARIKQELARIQDNRLSVAVETAKADAKLAALVEESRKLKQELKVNPDVDATAAKARIEEIAAEIRSIRDAKIQVRIDTTEANARIAALRTELAGVQEERKAKITAETSAALARIAEAKAAADAAAKDRTLKFNVDVAGVSGGFSGLAAGISLLPALIPIAAAAVPAVTGIGAAAAGAAAGVGVLKLAFSGIGDAVTALGTQSSQTGQQLAQQAAQQLASADSIINAQEAVRNAITGVADARRQAAQNVTAAENTLRTSQQSLTAAIYSENQAQVNLTAARVQAAQTLQDLNNSVKDGALSQRQAILDLQDAQRNLTVTDFNPHSTPEERAQAQLQVDQAKQHLAEIGQSNDRLAAQKAKADKDGVANAPAVVAAEHAVKDATQARQNAQADVVRNQSAIVEAQRAGNQQIVQAQQQVTDSQRALILAYAQAGAAGVASANAVNVAMSKLTPAGQAFAHFVNDELKPAFKDITDAAQTGFLPGFQQALTILLPYLPGFAKYVGEVATQLGNMAVSAANALRSPFWKQFGTFIGDLAKSSLADLGKILGNLVTGFAGLFEGLMPTTDGLGGALVNLSARFATFGQTLSTNDGFQKFIKFIKDNTPNVLALFKNLGEVFGKLIIAFAPLGAVLVVLIEKLAAALASLTPAELIGIAAYIGAIAIALTLVGGPFEAVTVGVTGLVLALTAIAGALVYAYTHFKTFHDIVNAVWHDVSVAFKFEWDNVWHPTINFLILAITHLWTDVIKPVYQFIKDNWRSVADAYALVWNTVLKPVFDAVGQAISSLWSGTIVPVFTHIGGLWHDVLTGISKTYTDVLVPVWGAMTTAFSSVKSAFSTFKDDLSTIWGDIQTVFVTGVNFVTQNVLNRFIDAINKVTGILGIPSIPDIAKITVASKPSGTVGSGATHGTGSGGKGGRTPSTFAHGGTVPGYAPGVDSFAAMLSPGEGVLVPEAVRGLGGAGFVEAINRRFSSRLPGSNGHYAGGGVVGSVLGAVGSAANTVKNAVGNVIGGVEGAALSAAESPINALINTLSPLIVKQLAQGGFNQIDKGIRAFIGAHPQTANSSSAGATGAVVSGPSSGTSLDYAKIIMNQAKGMNLGVKGAEIGLMTALVESNLKNYANSKIPESLALPHDAVGSDHFSAGLFQQQTGPFGNYWGTVAQVMNPAYSAHRFFDELLRKVPGYQGIDSGVAAQTVQVSAFPDAYDRRKGDADSLIQRLKYDDGGLLPPGITQVVNNTGRPEPVFTPAQLSQMGIGESRSSGKPPVQIDVHPSADMDEVALAMDVARQFAFASTT